MQSAVTSDQPSRVRSTRTRAPAPTSQYRDSPRLADLRSFTGTTAADTTPAPGLTAGAVPAAYATVTSPDGGPVKLRKSASRGETLYWLVGAGARVRVERTRDGWSLVTALCTDGYTRRAWMMDAYLRR